MTPKYIRMFGEIKSDVHNELVSSSIRRNKLLEIHQDLWQLGSAGRRQIWKLRQYFDMRNESFGKNSKYLLTSNITIDETKVHYYGSHASKQHIHGKPIRFGYKLWSASTSAGYLIHFISYQDSKANPLPKQGSLGIGAAVVINLDKLPKEVDHCSFYFDKFSTGLPLLGLEL